MERILVQDHNDGKGYSATLFENDQQLIDAAIERLGFSYREYRAEDLEFVGNEIVERLLERHSVVAVINTQGNSNYCIRGPLNRFNGIMKRPERPSIKYTIVSEFPTKIEAAIIAFERLDGDYGLFTIPEAVQFIKDHHAAMHIETYKAITKILKPKLKYKFVSEETVMIENTGHDKPLVWIARDDQHIIDTAFDSAELTFNKYTKDDIDDDTCPEFLKMLEKHDCVIEAGTWTESEYYSLDEAPSLLGAALDAIESHVLNLCTLTMTEARLLVDGDKSQYTGRHRIEVTEAIKNLIDV